MAVFWAQVWITRCRFLGNNADQAGGLGAWSNAQVKLYFRVVPMGQNVATAHISTTSICAASMTHNAQRLSSSTQQQNT
jgi:hypothetical protein